MADALPRLLDDVSFVVEGREAVGPQPLAEIVRSIRTGERNAHSLVWWANASGWQFFDEHPNLLELLSVEQQSSLRTEILEPEDSDLPVVVKQPPSIEGLFSANARKENGLSGGIASAKIDKVDAILSARTLVATAEKEAMSNASRVARHDTLAAALSGPSALVEARSGESQEASAAANQTDDSDLSGEDPSAGNTSELPKAARLEGRTEGTNSEDGVDDDADPEESKHAQTFDEMVKKSDAHQRRLEWATRVDELMLSGCIAAVTERGYLAADVSSRGTEHRVLFESGSDGRHVVVQIVPLSQVNVAGEDVGLHLQIKMSWGQNVNDVDAAFAVVRSLASDDPAKPGKVRAEIDAVASRVYTTVNLIWAAEDFVSSDYDIDSVALDDAIAAALHILERRWYKLFIRRR